MSIADHVPTWMLQTGPWSLAIWQWLGLTAALATGYVLGGLAAAVAKRIARAITRRTTTNLDDELLSRLDGPMRLLLTIAAVRLQLPLIELHDEASAGVGGVLLAALGVTILWATLRSIDIVVSRITAAAWAVARPTSRALFSLLGRIAKAIVIVIAGIAFLGALGIPVTSLLAGLGIGGVALAFGAQKTVENLFGAVAIGVDQPLREGDFVMLDNDVLGNVESVGLRSTRVRTLDRTVVTLPNGKVADMKIETFAPRDRIRLLATIGVVYDTTAAQLREVLAGFERVLRAHPNIWADDVIVRFVKFGDSSLDIEIMAWLVTTDFGQFRSWRQEILIQFIEIVEQAGASFAFPTRTVHLVAAKAA